MQNDGVIDDEEFILLYEQYFSRNPDFPYHGYPDFHLEEVDESECLALSDVLQIPAVIECEQR